MTKITSEQIKQMTKLLSEGKSYYRIALIMKLSYFTVYYYLNNDQRIKQINRAKKNYRELSPKQKHEQYIRHKDYQLNWFKDKYHNDSEFRKKFIEGVLKRKKEKREGKKHL